MRPRSARFLTRASRSSTTNQVGCRRDIGFPRGCLALPFQRVAITGSPLSVSTRGLGAEISAEEKKATIQYLEGLRLFEELSPTACNQRLLATDLHAGNILRAQREPWLVIDPKPFIGDPTYDLTQHLFNCMERLQRDPHGTIRRLSDLAEVDHDRVRLWKFARAAAEPRSDWRRDPLAGLARRLAK